VTVRPHVPSIAWAHTNTANGLRSVAIEPPAIARRLVLVVLFRLVLRRFFRVLGGNKMVPVCKMGVMPCRLVSTRLMVLCGLLVMTRSVLVVFCRFLVMLRTLVFCHFRRSSFLDYGGTYKLSAPAECFQKCYVAVN
jgi:hypothetical protein